jgi:hypothetical protein
MNLLFKKYETPYKVLPHGAIYIGVPLNREKIKIYG